MLDGPRLPPASGGPAKSLVVFLHGYGANGDDLIEIGRVWAPVLPDTAFVSPHAPEPCPEAPPGGRQWFPLSLTDMQVVADGVRGAAPAIDAFLDAELARHGLDDRALALVGFSQGAMMALQVGPRRTRRIAGIVAYSGMLAGPEALVEAPADKPPVLLLHGAADPVVPVVALHAAVSALGAADFAVEWHVSPHLEHGIDQDGLEMGAGFLRRVLG
jgi:phospholipase/carboxylesterase